MPQTDRRCATCRHYNRFTRTGGLCKWESPVPAPWWVKRDSMDGVIVFGNLGKDCEVWEEKETSDAAADAR